MLQPARRKYRKEHKGRNTGIATRGNTVAFGDFGLKSTDRGRLTARQIESARRAISRHVKRGGRIWIRVFPDKPISTKPAEVRMGNGKGNPEYYVAEIQPGKVLSATAKCWKIPLKCSLGRVAQRSMAAIAASKSERTLNPMRPIPVSTLKWQCTSTPAFWAAEESALAYSSE